LIPPGHAAQLATARELYYGTPQAPIDRFAVDSHVLHSKIGSGWVTAAGADRITVKFAIGGELDFAAEWFFKPNARLWVIGTRAQKTKGAT
jgi:hypothetical protein